MHRKMRSIQKWKTKMWKRYAINSIYRIYCELKLVFDLVFFVLFLFLEFISVLFFNLVYLDGGIHIFFEFFLAWIKNASL